MTEKKVILFVCMGNRYRSRIAEEIFNRNAPKGFIAQSAGVTYQKYNDRATPKVLKEIGIEMNCRKPSKISKQMIEKVSKIVLFEGAQVSSKKVEAIWPIEDCHDGDIKCIRRGREKIEKLVENMVKSL